MAHDGRVRRLLVPIVVALALVAGLVLKLAGESRVADGLWILVLLAVILPLAFAVLQADAARPAGGRRDRAARDRGLARPGRVRGWPGRRARCSREASSSTTGRSAAPAASWRPSPSGRPPWPTAMTARGSSTCLRPRCAPATCWRSSPVRSCPWTAFSCTARPCSTRQRSPASRCPHGALPVTRSAAERASWGRRSRFARCARQRLRPMRASCAW